MTHARPPLAALCGAALFLCPAAAPAADDNGVRDATDPMVAQIDTLIRRSWDENEVRPSPRASDAEWLRRAYLDIAGHIPPAAAVQAFLRDKDENKRARVVDELLDSPDYVRNFATVWTNLSIGQGEPENTSRLGMRRFYREVFAKNRPWNDVVYDLLAASGNFERNGAVNFLLAQMVEPDEQVTATGKAARLLLGMQVQCTQCHNHPFNDWKQEQFWSFNAILRGVERKDVEEFDPQTGQNEFRYAELVDRPVDGPVFFEKRSGLMQVAYPAVLDVKLEDLDLKSEGDAPLTRREEAAKFLTGPESDQVARAFVNRAWAHFFGYGFTRPVDDMGPHNPPSHPELLDTLTAEFVAGGYDVRRLYAAIAKSEPYQLTSRITKDNAIDDPAAGETPLFSHMSVKRMGAEQLYDSLLVATNAAESGRADWDEIEKQRREWLQQFVVAFGTDENDEATTFNGSIPQALMMMNGELTENALSGKPGSFLHTVLTGAKNPREAIDALFLATLGRTPDRGEADAAQALFKASGSPEYAYQDLFWALLNSNEFIFVK